jgi:hypothetical protein
VIYANRYLHKYLWRCTAQDRETQKRETSSLQPLFAFILRFAMYMSLHAGEVGDGTSVLPLFSEIPFYGMSSAAHASGLPFVLEFARFLLFLQASA